MVNNNILDDDFLTKLEESDPAKNQNQDKKEVPNIQQEKQKTKLELEKERLREQQKELLEEENKHSTNIEKTDIKTEFESSMDEYKVKPVEETIKEEKLVEEPVQTDKKPIEKVQWDNNQKQQKQKSKKTKEVHIMNSKEYSEKENNKNPVSENTLKSVDISEDMEDKFTETNSNILVKNNIDVVKETMSEEMMEESVNSFIAKTYSDDEESNDKVEVVIVKEENIENNVEEKPSETKQIEEDDKRRQNVYGNGDGNRSFLTRASNVSKMVKNIKIEDTSNIDPIDISQKPMAEQQNIYLNTILPTLNPCFSVTPLIISGVVITMTAFSWPDIMEICKIDEKVDTNLDPSSDDYIYDKNNLFIEKRRKQLDLFYKHIYSVSGYATKPSQDELFGEIIKFPDLQQLFFAAYSASFQKPYPFGITCNTCENTEEKEVAPKNLCYLLNKHIDVNRLNRILEKGSTIATDEDSKALFEEFQREEIVEKSKAVYRTKTSLPMTAMIASLKIPTINEALETLEYINDVFRDQPFEVITENGDTVSIDSSFGLTKELLTLKNYLYINSIIGANPNKNKDDPNKIEVAYFEFKEKESIINTIYNLTGSDYKALMSDPNLQSIVKVRGITHAIDAGTCSNKTCNSELGLIQVDPEMLFFTIGKQELQD